MLGPEIPYFDYPRVPLDRKHQPSMRVPPNPQGFWDMMQLCDSGINARIHNREQTGGDRVRAENICGMQTVTTAPVSRSPSGICGITGITARSVQ